MEITEAINRHLAADPDVSGLVGNRIYPVAIEQGAGDPAIVMRIDNATFTHTLSGSRGPQVECDYEIMSLGLDYDTARSTAREVRTCLQGFSGQMGGPTGPEVQHCLISSEREAGLEIAPDDVRIGIAQVFRIKFRE